MSGVDDSDASGVSARSLAESPAVQLGQVLDKRYRLDAAIGRGGMGWVFRATDLRLQRTVAVKVLPPDIAADPAMRKRFEREALASSRMNSPYIVVIHDFGQDGDIVFLVMELLEGRTLRRQMAERGALPVREAVDIVLGIARALVHAHGVGVAHRDLKPSNVFLTHDGEKVKVLDFGIAKLVDEPAGPTSMTLTTTGTLMGTPLYMSPEAIKRGATVGPPADLYGLGLLTYQMLVGRPPFLHDEPVVVLGMHVRDTPPRLADAGTDAPPELDVLVDRLLAKDAASRPTAAEVVRALDGLRVDAPTTDPSVRPAPPPASLEPEPLTIPSAPDLALAFESQESVSPSLAPLAAPSEPAPSARRVPWLLVVAVGVGAAVFGLGLVVALLAVGGQGDASPAESGDGASVVPAQVGAPRADESSSAPAADPVVVDPVVADPVVTPSLVDEPDIAADPVADVVDAPEVDEPATAVQAPAAGPAILEVRTDVPATVEVDGEVLGATPGSFTLPAGAHRVTLRATDGPAQRTIRVRLEPGATETRRVALAPHPVPSPAPSPGPSPAGTAGDLIPPSW